MNFNAAAPRIATIPDTIIISRRENPEFRFMDEPSERFTVVKFVQKSQVSINPVNSAAAVKEITGGKLSSGGSALIGSSSASPLPSGNPGSFKIKGPFTCNGAVVFDGPVLIEQADIKTTSSCRIYSTRSIFVFNGMTVSGNDNANIQLVSPVYIGLDIGYASVVNRFEGHGNEWLPRHSFSMGGYQTPMAMLKADMDRLGIASYAGEGTRSYEKVAMAAPLIFSRSKGVLSGVVIAEMFLGPVHSTSFRFDNVFAGSSSTVTLWPEIKTSMVEVVD